MADNTIKMLKANSYGQHNNHKQAYEYEQSITANGGNTKYVLIPQDVSNVSVQVKLASSATAKVQTSVDGIAKLIADTAIWVDWAKGSIATNDQQAFNPPSAMRLNKTNASGAATLSMRAQ